MPKIYLKPKSPEFDDHQPNTAERMCEMPGCHADANHKAPKDRSLGEYWHLCLDHVREYNKAWNFFVGMSDTEIYDHMVKSAMWDRPTWSSKHDYGAFEEQLKDKAWHAAKGMDEGDPPPHSEKQNRRVNIDPTTPEGQALNIMGLEPPVTFDDIKIKYKSLMKEYHPDLRKGDVEAEELVKQVNMAYTILKVSYQKYEKIAEKFE